MRFVVASLFSPNAFCKHLEHNVEKHSILFPAGVFHETFKSLSHIEPEVLYPIPDFSAFNKPVEKPSPDLMPRDVKCIFLSINRYERKKNLNLAIEALGKIPLIPAMGWSSWDGLRGLN